MSPLAALRPGADSSPRPPIRVLVVDDQVLYAEALSVLAQPSPPGGTALCTWCVYRDASRRTGY